MAGAQQGSEGSGQAAYVETPYEDQSWEVVGTFKDERIFVPTQFEVAQSEAFQHDKMFADFGGHSHGMTTRVHGDDVDGRIGGLTANKRDYDQEMADLRAQHIQELEAARAESREEGRMVALQEMIEKQNAHLEQLRERFGTLLKDLNAQFEERVQLAQGRALELSLEIGRKIIETAVEVNPEYIVPILKEAIHHTGTASVLSVRVSPEDMEFIRIVGVDRQLSEYDGTWQFVADPTVKSGCIVDTSAGEIDFQLDKAWERMKDSIIRVTR